MESGTTAKEACSNLFDCTDVSEGDRRMGGGTNKKAATQYLGLCSDNEAQSVYSDDITVCTTLPTMIVVPGSLSVIEESSLMS